MKKELKELSIAFIGCGNLCTSLVKGLLASGCSPQNIWATNRSTEKNEQLRKSLGIHVSENNDAALEHADIVVLGVKPQQMRDLAVDISAALKKRHPLIISVAIGITTVQLSRWLGKHDMSIVRSMPNTPALVSAGASGLFANSWVTKEQKNLAESLHRAVGLAVWVEKESLINVVAALSGSGPAYFFYMIEAMQRAAIQLGLPEKIANELALQTCLGASKLALDSTDDVSTLRRHVTSPKGTTEQAIKVFDENNLNAILEKAMTATIHRAEELTQLFDQPTL